MEGEQSIPPQIPTEANLCIATDIQDQDATSLIIPTSSECSTPTNLLSRASPNLGDSGPMLYDPTLPPGWSRRVTQRTMGASAGKYDVYIFSPDKKKIRSKTDLILYLDRNNLDLDPDKFDFTVRGRHNMPQRKSGTQKKKTSLKLIKPTPEVKQNGGLAVDIPKNLGPTTSPAAGNANSNNGANSNKPKLIVKLSFPVPRLKRSASMRSRKKKIIRQKSHSSQSSSMDDPSESMEVPTEPGSEFSELSDNLSKPASTSHATDLTNCDMPSESELFI